MLPALPAWPGPLMPSMRTPKVAVDAMLIVPLERVKVWLVPAHEPTEKRSARRRKPAVPPLTMRLPLSALSKALSVPLCTTIVWPVLLRPALVEVVPVPAKIISDPLAPLILPMVLVPLWLTVKAPVAPFVLLLLRVAIPLTLPKVTAPDPAVTDTVPEFE